MSATITFATPELSVPPALNTHPAFSSPDANVVLRSSDDMLFRASSDVLSRASGWLKTMFTLPQDPTTVDRLEPIPMSEPASILVVLLSIADCRPIPTLNHRSDDLEPLLAAAEKYEMPTVISVVRLAFASRFSALAPLRIYGIACRMGWEEEAKDASSRTLTQDLLAPEAQAELAAMTPHHRILLLDLHRRRREEFFKKLDDPASFYANVCGGPCGYGSPADPTKPCSAVLDHGHWWALKYALMRQWTQKPYDLQLDETFHYMPEVKSVFLAKCHQCDRTLYSVAPTLKKINDIIRELPRCVDWP